MKVLYPSLLQIVSLLLIAVPCLTPIFAQTPLWGLTSIGGQGAGSIFNVNDNGSNFSSVTFPFIEGIAPSGDLLKATNGKFYGMSTQGGINGGGVIFEYDLALDNYQVMHHFENGSFPKGSLIETGGKLYGMTSGGGSFNFGVIFEFNLISTAYSVLYDFGTGPEDGKYPEGSLIVSDGNFYGMTAYGGTNELGTIFQFDPSGFGTHTVMHSFDDSDGSSPYGSLIILGQTLYGLTSGGGTFSAGVIFEFNLLAASINILHNFDDDIPYGSLVEYNGNLYGMTLAGGDNFSGSIFEYTPSLVNPEYNELFSFDNISDGGYPFGSLVEYNGKLFGMTNGGGGDELGVLFEYDLSPPLSTNNFRILHDFESGQLDGGAAPYGSPIISNGKLYGLTSGSGFAGIGSLFEYEISGGLYNEKVGFGKASLGSAPEGGLVRSGTNWYGMTKTGGSFNKGTIFKYDPLGLGMLSALHHFSGVDGSSPSDNLILFEGNLYGMTSEGGTNDGGVLLEYNLTTSTYDVKHEFAAGSSPKGSLLEWNGVFYGLTSNGGTGLGEIFKFDPFTNIYTSLHQFDGSDGMFPNASLVQLDGFLYGMTTTANNGPGVLFQFDPMTLVYDELHFYAGGANDGAAPYGTLVILKGSLYGMTRDGGDTNQGIIFKYNSSGTGTYTILHEFDINTGGNPEGSLSVLNDSLYGMTKQGGTFAGGVIFKCDTTGISYTVLKHLTETSGQSPSGSLSSGDCTVTNTNDSGDGSLRAAIACTSEGGTITFDPRVLRIIDTITISSASLDINKNINIIQTASTIVKIKSTGSNPIFNISAGKSLTLNYVDLFVNLNPNTVGRAILNNGHLQILNVNIKEKSQNLSGSGSTFQNESGGSLNVSSTNQITTQN